MKSSTFILLGGLIVGIAIAALFDLISGSDVSKSLPADTGIVSSPFSWWWIIVVIVAILATVLYKRWQTGMFDENPSQRDPSTHPSDADVPRNRGGRTIVFLSYIFLIPTICTAFSWWVGENLFNNQIIVRVFATLGFGGSVIFTISSIETLFVVRNSTTGMFITQDMLRSFLGLDNVNVPYGPGQFLIKYPWEKRLPENNISLKEAPEDFEFTVQCKDGILKGQGSFRMRPDPRNPIAFLTGVASVAKEIEDLFIAEILAELSGLPVLEALDKIKGLNDHLKLFRTSNLLDVQTRFGVIITDVTVSKLLPSDDLQKSLSAKAEAVAIQQGTLIILGKKTWKAVETAIQNGTLTQADVNLARDRFLSISGNLEGMNIDRKEYDFSIHGLDAGVVEAIASFFSSPAGQAIASNIGKSGKSGKRPAKP